MKRTGLAVFRTGYGARIAGTVAVCPGLFKTVPLADAACGGRPTGCGAGRWTIFAAAGAPGFGRAIRQGAGLCEYLPAAFGTRVRGPGGGSALIAAILCTGGLAVCSRTIVIGPGLFKRDAVADSVG